VALRPNAGHGLLILEVSRSHLTTPHSRQDSSGRVISPSQRPLSDNTQHLQQTNIHPPRWDSNPRSQQVSGRRPMPWTARPLGPAQIRHYRNISTRNWSRIPWDPPSALWESQLQSVCMLCKCCLKYKLLGEVISGKTRLWTNEHALTIGTLVWVSLIALVRVSI